MRFSNTPITSQALRGRSQIGVGMQTDACATRQIVEPNVLLKPADVLAHINELGISHGLYGWWFDHALPGVLRDGCLPPFNLSTPPRACVFWQSPRETAGWCASLP